MNTSNCEKLQNFEDSFLDFLEEKLEIEGYWKKVVWFNIFSRPGVVMQTPTQDEVLDEKKWSELTAPEKSKILTTFLNECGGNGSWEEWRNFLKKHQVKDF